MPSTARADAASPSLAEPSRGGSISLGLLAVYLLLILLGTFALHRSGVMVNGEELTYDRATFLAVNSATLGGFQQSVGVNDFNPDNGSGPAIVLLLTLGGSLFVLVVGGLAGVRALRLPYSDLQVVTAALTAHLLTILLGAAVLLTGGANGFDAIQQSASAFGNSGVLTCGQKLVPALTSWQAQGVLLPLAIIGGLGLPVLMELYDAALGRRSLSTHSRIVLALTAIAYLAAMVLLLICLRPQGPFTNTADAHAQWRWAIGASSAAAVNARTAGFPFTPGGGGARVDFVNSFPRVAQWVLVLLMAVGASSAGTAGGIKTTTLYHLITGTHSALRGRPAGRVFGIAAVWTAAYLVIAIAGFLLLTVSDSQLPSDRLIFLTISALSNVGLANDPVSVVGPGLFLLAGLLLIGRLAPLAVLWWLAMTTDDVDVLVG
ncbi:MAG: ktrB ntpJ [Phycisphaerales bacterium]|nr:ktrB ntpJ [Phycisphaerales bacterium]